MAYDDMYRHLGLTRGDAHTNIEQDYHTNIERDSI